MRRFVPLVLILSIIALIPLSLPKGLGVESNLVILDFYYYEDTAGYSNVIGEVENQGTTTTTFMQVNVTFYDAFDTPVAAEYSYTIVDILLPGEISPFEVSSFPLANLSVSYYEIEVTYYDTEEVPYREFEITGLSEDITYGWFDVSGEVENIGFINASFVNIVASFYDENETLITYDFDYIDPDVLEPGQRATFEVSTFPDEVLPASYALMVQCMETREASTIMCVMEPTITEDALIVDGILQPALDQADVTLMYTPPNESSLYHVVTTGGDGSFFDVIEDPVPGEWSVIAVWLGDETYAGAASEPAVVTLSTWVTNLTCITTATNLSVGIPLRLEGTLTPSYASPASITLEYTTDTLWQSLTTLTTQVNGSYSYLWTPTSSGDYFIRARYAGTPKYAASVSSILNLELQQRATTLSCTAPSTAVDVGKPLTVTGRITPAVAGITVTLTYQPPSGAAITRSITTNADGEYSDAYTPSDTGAWSVTARWNGNTDYDAATSTTQAFTVQKSGCLIATATFGSVLTPQVQFLRNFRDHRVLTTFAGRQFLEVFNSVYYSFSPQVADSIRATQGLRLVMTVIISPLIGVLQVSEHAFTVLSGSPELAIILAGGLASTLLAVIYVVPGALFVSLWTRRTPSKRWVTAFGLLWLASVTAMSIAELSHAEWLMGTATSTFVLATMGVTLVTVLRQTPQVLGALRHTITRLRR
jgi:peptide/nickel transport system substrate-binding protein